MPKTLSETEVAEFRTRLCEAAARMFVEKGPEAVTMRTLAKELGCSAMTPYRYFKDKQAILAAVRTKGFEELADTLESVRAVSGDLAASATVLGGNYWAFASARPHVYRMMFDVGSEEGDSPAFLKAKDRVCASLMAAIDRAGGPSSPKGDEAAICQSVMSALHGATMLKLSGLMDKNTCPAALASRLIVALVSARAERKPNARKG